MTTLPPIPITLSQAVQMASASYERGSSCAQYLAQNCPEIEIIAQATIKNNSWIKRISGSWQVVVYRIKNTNKAWTSIEGTVSFRNKIGDVFHQFSDETILSSLVKKIHTFIESSVKENGLQLEGFSSHSAGGLINRKLKDWFYGDTVWNIAFNSQKPGRNNILTINLQAPGDLIKSTIVTSRTIRVEGIKGHSLNEYLKIKTWEEIHPSLTSLKNPEATTKAIISEGTEVVAKTPTSTASTPTKGTTLGQRIIVNGAGAVFGLLVVEKWIVFKDKIHSKEDCAIRVSALFTSSMAFAINLYRESSLTLGFFSSFATPVITGALTRQMSQRLFVNEPRPQQGEGWQIKEWFFSAMQKCSTFADNAANGFYHATFQPCNNYYKLKYEPLGMGPRTSCDFCNRRFGYTLFSRYEGLHSTLLLWKRKWFG